MSVKLYQEIVHDVECDPPEGALYRTAVDTYFIDRLPPYGGETPTERILDRLVVWDAMNTDGYGSWGVEKEDVKEAVRDFGELAERGDEDAMALAEVLTEAMERSNDGFVNFATY